MSVCESVYMYVCVWMCVCVSDHEYVYTKDDVIKCHLILHRGDISLGPPVHCSWEVSLCEVHWSGFALLWLPRSVPFVHHGELLRLLQEKHSMFVLFSALMGEVKRYSTQNSSYPLN